jgi:glycerol-3-phosphate dehydrogenase (NAD(P)+)
MTTTFAILGDGGWGTAIALLLAQRPDHAVWLWSAREDYGRLLQERRENTQYLPGLPLPPAVRLTWQLDQALADRPDLVIVAIPTIYLRSTIQRIARELAAVGAPLLSLTKGLERETFRRPTEILGELLQTDRLAVLSGPSHAEEVARGRPTTVVVASQDVTLARWVQEHFRTERFRPYTNLDPVGVELAGALKNIIGIAGGVCIGLGLGDNALSALMTRGLVEMTRFGVALGADPATFQGLAGMGDLITTCISPHGRNRAVGLRLAAGESLSAILATMSMVAEGVATAHSVHGRAAQMGIDMPITAEVYRILYEGKDARAAVTDLMVRRTKEEGW